MLSEIQQGIVKEFWEGYESSCLNTISTDRYLIKQLIDRTFGWDYFHNWFELLPFPHIEVNFELSVGTVGDLVSNSELSDESFNFNKALYYGTVGGLLKDDYYLFKQRLLGFLSGRYHQFFVLSELAFTRKNIINDEFCTKVFLPYFPSGDFKMGWHPSNHYVTQFYGLWDCFFRGDSIG